MPSRPELPAPCAPADEPSLAAKVEALRTPACYPAPPGPITPVETHMSWVFLTAQHAWKLKKPVRYDHQDFRTPAGRRFYCLEELRVNRRLAPWVYLDVLPLTLEPAGSLRIGGAGCAVDWLVQMRRLAAEDMLDARIARGAATPAHMQAVAQRLAPFYRGQPPAPLSTRAYRALLLRHVEEAERELCDSAWELPAARVRALCDRQRAIVRTHAAVFDARVAAGRVVEGHGDLRPEHVWLGEPLAIIDSLEFSSELRLQDAADEVGFLALECERMHARALGEALLAAYRAASGDDAPAALVHFYQSCKAGIRARLAIAHLREPHYRGSPKWRRRTLRYLALAERHLAQAQF